jgi:hypothetical protein
MIASPSFVRLACGTPWCCPQSHAALPNPLVLFHEHEHDTSLPVGDRVGIPRYVGRARPPVILLAPRVAVFLRCPLDSFAILALSAPGSVVSAETTLHQLLPLAFNSVKT